MWSWKVRKRTSVQTTVWTTFEYQTVQYLNASAVWAFGFSEFRWMLQYVAAMIQPKCKVPTLVHTIMLISKHEQENILRPQRYCIMFCANFKSAQKIRTFKKWWQMKYHYQIFVSVGIWMTLKNSIIRSSLAEARQLSMRFTFPCVG